jgi:hypothetical protein
MVLVCLVIWGSAAANGVAQDESGEPLPPGSVKLDWVRWARVKAAPYIIGIENLADGDETTVAGQNTETSQKLFDNLVLNAMLS